MSDLDKKYTIRLDLINNIQNEKMRFSLSANTSEALNEYLNNNPIVLKYIADI